MLQEKEKLTFTENCPCVLQKFQLYALLFIIESQKS